jgi:hypothetical protein
LEILTTATAPPVGIPKINIFQAPDYLLFSNYNKIPNILVSRRRKSCSEGKIIQWSWAGAPICSFVIIRIKFKRVIPIWEIPMKGWKIRRKNF